MAIRFDAAGDYVYRTTSAPQQYPLTVLFRVYISVDRNAYGALFIMANGAGTSFIALNLSSSGTNLQISVGGSTTNGTNLSTGTWYDVALVIESATAQKAYLNGVLDINKTTSSYTFTPAQYFIGSDSAGFLNGRITDLKIIEAALTADEIQTERMLRRPVLFNPWAHYPMLSGSGERTRDYSGNGRGLTEAGTLTDEDLPPVSWGGGAWQSPELAAAPGASIIPIVMTYLRRMNPA